MKDQLEELLDRDNLKEFFRILSENYEKINRKSQFSRFKKEFEFGGYGYDFKSRLQVWLSSEEL